MTRLNGRIVTRQTETVHRADPLVVELHPRHLEMRIKGHPTSRVSVSYEAVFDLGRKLQARADFIAKQRSRAAKGGRVS